MASEFTLPAFDLSEFDIPDEIHTNDTPMVALERLLSRELNPFDSMVESIKSDKQKLVDKKRLITEESNRIQEEAQRAILKLIEDRRIIEAEIDELERQLREAELAEQERAAKEAELAVKLTEAQRLDELAKELADICKDFPAYFAAHEYQHDDLLFTINAYREGKRGILNANDMGLGKTFESIVALYILCAIFKSEYGRKPRVLWLTKKSLVSSTPREIKQWWPGAFVIMPTKKTINGKDREFLIELYDSGADIFLCNYEYARTTPKMHETPWDFIVIDEVHKLKGGANPGGPTAIWSAVKSLCKDARFVLMLSGTPMVNRQEEMWSYLHIFNPDKFPNLRQFERQFMNYKMIAGEFKLAVDANKILSEGLKGQMIRRSKDEVGMQLPDLQEIPRLLEMNQLQGELYEQMRTQFFVWLDQQGQVPLTAAAIIAQLTRLRQINTWPAGITVQDVFNPDRKIRLDVEDSSKIDEALDIILDLGEQCVVFCTFNEPMFEVQRRVISEGLTCEVIHGGSNVPSGTYEEKFQQGEIDVLCINLAMVEGLNLQRNPTQWPGGARTCIFIDKWWSPARNEQAVDRIHRQGQTHACTSYYLRNENSVDSFIDMKLAEKIESFASIMNSSEIRPATDWRSFLENLI